MCKCVHAHFDGRRLRRRSLPGRTAQWENEVRRADEVRGTVETKAMVMLLFFGGGREYLMLEVEERRGASRLDGAGKSKT